MNFLKKAAAEAEALQKKMQQAQQQMAEASLQDGKGAAAAPAAPAPAPLTEEQKAKEKEFDDKAELAIPGMVRMLSGCADKQTSADVSNTASFQLPADAGPGGAGGACTSSLLLATAKDAEDGRDDHTWVSLLDAMRETLKGKGYEQIPQLSSSRKLDLQHGKFSLLNPEAAAGSKKRAVLVGINYVGQRGELRGCHNDVLSMKRFIEKRGFSDMRVLMDDSSHEQPTGKNILVAIDWLTEGASKGDSLFLHYSGHGGYVKDDNGDEADGMDETIVPVDFQSAGQIIDDLLFKELVMPIPAGVQLTCVMDCCHSGTVLDLPYMVKASEQLAGTAAAMQQNPGFSFEKLLKIAKNLYDLKQQGASNSQLLQQAHRDLMPMIGSAGAGTQGGAQSGSAGGAMNQMMAALNSGGKETGGMGNLFAMMGGKKPSSGLPGLPF